ncbi:MAG: putative RND superfamily exporter protein, partial [Myxococcota bacterium]
MTDDKAVSVVETPGKQGPVERLVGLIERRPWWILLCAAVLAGTSVWLATQLRVNQNLSALLPPDAESLTRLEALQSRMGTLNDLIVEIKSPSRE